MGSQDGSPLRETRKDPFSAAAAECSCRQDGLTVIVTACLTFATGVTVALVMQIYFGDPQVRGADGLKGTWVKGGERVMGIEWLRWWEAARKWEGKRKEMAQDDQEDRKRDSRLMEVLEGGGGHHPTSPLFSCS